jgi:spore coat polysaccharide biosynthesis protein SpsF (cytidylyltransferase family)
MANKAIKKLAKYTIIKGILYRIVKTRDGSKVVTVITKSMRKDILFTVHDDPMGG